MLRIIKKPIKNTLLLILICNFIFAGNFKIFSNFEGINSQSFSNREIQYNPLSQLNSEIDLSIYSPYINYFSYFGGIGIESPQDIHIDNSGFIYILLNTATYNLPTTYNFSNNDLDGSCIYLAKLTPDGQALVFGTYIGGNQTDSSMKMIVDEDNSIYIAGTTSSSNFPTTIGSFNQTYAGNTDTFIMKINPSGNSLNYSTYIGGSDFERPLALTKDSNNSIYILGNTYSFDFPTVNPYNSTKNGNQDIFFMKISSNGSSLEYSTYFGGENEIF